MPLSEKFLPAEYWMKSAGKMAAFPTNIFSMQILLLEKWFSEDHQKAHMKQPHMDILMTIKNRYIKDVTIERFC